MNFVNLLFSLGVDSLLLMLPIVVAVVLHMCVVKLDTLAFLKIPLSPKLFGNNKTWRGFVAMPLFAALAIWPMRHLELFSSLKVPVLSLGLLIGLAYSLAELPNSYLKRRMGVPPGKRSERYVGLFILLDQTDSGVGCALVYIVFGGIPWITALTGVVVGICIHLAVNFALYWIGIRKEPL